MRWVGPSMLDTIGRISISEPEFVGLDEMVESWEIRV